MSLCGRQRLTPLGTFVARGLVFTQKPALAGGLVSSVRVSRRAEGRAVVAAARAGCGRGAVASPAPAPRRAGPGGRPPPAPSPGLAAPAAAPPGPRQRSAPRAAGDPHSRAPPPPLASLSARSGTLALSLQSPLHLSLAVLVRYRSPTGAQPWVGLTTRFELQSQAARLVGAPARSLARRRCAADSARSTGLSPSLAPSSKGLRAGRAGGRGAPAGHTPAARRPVLSLGCVPLHSPLLGESSFVSLPSAY